MGGWNTSFLLGWPVFRGYASFRECTHLGLAIQNRAKNLLQQKDAAKILKTSKSKKTSYNMYRLSTHIQPESSYHTV